MPSIQKAARRATKKSREIEVDAQNIAGKFVDSADGNTAENRAFAITKKSSGWPDIAQTHAEEEQEFYYLHCA